MNIRFIITFSFLMCLFSGSAEAMQGQCHDDVQAMREMVNPLKDDETLKRVFAPAIIDSNREILNWKVDVFDKISVEEREERLECIELYLQQFGNPNDREKRAGLLRIAGCGETPVGEAEENIGKGAWLIGVSQQQEQEEQEQKDEDKVADEVQKSINPEPSSRSLAQYIVPAAVICSGVALGVFYHYFLKHKK